MKNIWHSTIANSFLAFFFVIVFCSFFFFFILFYKIFFLVFCCCWWCCFLYYYYFLRFFFLQKNVNKINLSFLFTKNRVGGDFLNKKKFFRIYFVFFVYVLICLQKRKEKNCDHFFLVFPSTGNKFT